MAGKLYAPNAVSRPVGSLIVLLFSVYAALCLLPVALVLVVSLSDDKAVTDDGFSFFPSHWSLRAYVYLFENSEAIFGAYGATITATAVGTLAGLFMTAAFAYPLSRTDFRMRGVFAFYAFFTLLFNGGLVPWYIVFSRYLHVADTIWALIVPGLLMNAFFILLMRTFFALSVPPEMYESALIDGAGDLTVFFRIVLPLSTPALATVGLFYVLQYWNDWYNSLIFQTQDRHIGLPYLMERTLLNIQYLLQHSQAQTNADFPGATIQMAMAIAGIAPIVLIYPFFQRYLIRGLTVGALKG